MGHPVKLISLNPEVTLAPEPPEVVNLSEQLFIGDQTTTMTLTRKPLPSTNTQSPLETTSMSMDLTFDKDMWSQGGFPDGMANPWVHEKEKSAPFNQPYYLILNVAVGGTMGYFPDGECDKVWDNKDPHAVNSFWN